MRGTPAPPSLLVAGPGHRGGTRHPLAPWPDSLLVVVVGRLDERGPAPRGRALRGARWPRAVEVLVIDEWIPEVFLDVDGRLADRASDSPFDLALGRAVARSLPGPVDAVRRASPTAVLDRVRTAVGAVAVVVPPVRGLRGRWRRRRLRRRLVRLGAVDLAADVELD